MLTDKNGFWNTIKEIAEEDFTKQSSLNKVIAQTETTIEKLLQADKINVGQLVDELTLLSQERCSISYIQGLQDGVKMLHVLLSGGAVSQMMTLEGVQADNKYSLDWLKMQRGS